jgi:hypothetical protein
LGAALVALVIGGFGYGVSITLWVAGARDLGAARGQLVFATRAVRRSCGRLDGVG